MITRLLVSIGLLASLSTTNAQDLQELMRQAMMQGAPGKRMLLEDTSAFVPLSFTGSFLIEVNTHRTDLEQADAPLRMRYHFSPDQMAFEPLADPAQGTMRTVFDLKNKHMTMLITDGNGQRTAMRTRLMKVDLDALSNATEDQPVNVVRTGGTRTIDGRLCHQYIATSADGRSEAWLAEDVPFNMKETFGRMATGRNTGSWQRLPYDGGLLMELTQTKPDSGEKTVIRTHDLVIGKVDQQVFSTEGYSVVDLTNLPLPGQ